MSDGEGLFAIDGHRITPSRLTGGPWDATTQHGSAPTMLAAYLAEQVPVQVPMQVSRLTIDLIRPVPIAPLTYVIEVLREGRKIQLIRIVLSAGDKPVMKAEVLRIRRTDEATETVSRPPVTLPLPDDCPVTETGDGLSNPFISNLDVRSAKGGFRTAGPGAVWFRLNRPTVTGAAITPLMRAVAAADFGNGVSSILNTKRWTFLNADLTISLACLPRGEWVLLDAESWMGDNGTGIAAGRLADEQGYFGRSVQTLVVEKRAPTA